MVRLLSGRSLVLGPIDRMVRICNANHLMSGFNYYRGLRMRFRCFFPRQALFGLVAVSSLAAAPTYADSGCRVDYEIINQWPTGFQAKVTLGNTTSQNVQGWNVTWTMPNGQQVTQLWNGKVTQAGDAVSVNDAGYNQVIPANASVNFGFIGSYNGPNSIPDAFALNGMSCGEMSPVGAPMGSTAQTPTTPTAPAAPQPDAAPGLSIAVQAESGQEIPVLRGLLPIRSPISSPPSAAKVELGRLLFFDPRLSDTGVFSCAVCHMPEKGWGDGMDTSPKSSGKLNTRHTPTMFNISYAAEYYWDGRQPSVESTSMAAWTGQMGGKPDEVAAELALIPEYAERFEAVFGSGPTGDQIPLALGAFIRTIQSGDSPWDRYQAGDKNAVSAQVVLGEQVFRNSNCTNCHIPPLYSDYKFHNIGADYEGNDAPDLGRGKITGNVDENGAFKTPTLRGVALHPPYFHDGSARTLEAAMDFMLAGGYRLGNPQIDSLLKPASVTSEERAALLAFLRSLSPDRPFERPVVPASPVVDAGGNGGAAGGAKNGKTFYDEQCAVCHGDDGIGVGGFPDTTVASLSGLYPTRQSLIAKIERTMPTFAPNACAGDCAALTADYILENFPGTSGGVAGGGGTGAGDGSVGSVSGGGGSGGSGGSGSPGDLGKGRDPLPLPKLVCSGETPAPRTLRLLTRREFDATTQDLLGVRSQKSIDVIPIEARKEGYDNNSGNNLVTARHVDSFLAVAEDLANKAVAQNRNGLLPCNPNQDAPRCKAAFVDALAPRAYRRPVTDQERSALLSIFDSAGADFDEGMRRTIIQMLLSPSFLYRSELGSPAGGGNFQLDAYEVASSLSYLFLGSMPDPELFQAAAENRLQRPEDLVAQAKRLLAKPRAREQLGIFMGQWLGADPFQTGQKDPKIYPRYTTAVQQASDQELVEFVNHVVFESTGQVQELFTANYVLANRVMANYYNLPGVNGNDFQLVQVPDGTRGGILGLTSVLASYAHSDDSSPIKRGVFVRERLLCHDLPDPPPAIDNTPPGLDPSLTTRERFAAHSESPFCQQCHSFIDDLGFGLERYNGAGEFRQSEFGMPIDDSGSIKALTGFDPKQLQANFPSTQFAGLRQLSDLLAQSTDVPDCLAKQYYRFARGRIDGEVDACTIDFMQKRFAAQDYDIQSLLISIVESPTFTLRKQ